LPHHIFTSQNKTANTFDHDTTEDAAMATSVQKNLEEKNAVYASGFDKGDLALPPAKSYIVG